MKEIKLEVGKTYRSQRGEEVKIVRKNNEDKYPYRGSNDRWYTERGRWGSDEGPNDLIEEVPATRHTFALVTKALTGRYTFSIPDGVKEVTVEQHGNRIVVEMVPEEAPKPGDVMVNEHGSVYIFKAIHCNGWHKHFAWRGDSGRLYFTSECLAGRPATPEEAKPLWDALKKAGKRWNPETMQVEDVPEIDRILEWVESNVEYGYYNHEDVAEAIEGYLKYREGEK